MTDPILIDAGKSDAGWSFWGPAFQCDQKWFLINVLGLKFGSTEALTIGSMGHTGIAHHYARTEAARKGLDFEGQWIEDPDFFLDPEEAIREWARRREREGVEAECYIHIAFDLLRRYRQREPYVSDTVIAVERQEKLTLGYNADGDYGLWIDEYLDEPHLLECPGLEEPVAGITTLQHGQPIIVTKRFDGVMRHRADGLDYIWDHKVTAGGIGKTRAMQYAMDGQFAVNRIIGRQLYGDRFGGVVLNLVQRRDPWGVSRQFVPDTPYRDAQFARQLHAKAYSLANQLVAHRKGDQLPGDWEMTQNEVVCYHRYGKCGAFELCQYGPKEA